MADYDIFREQLAIKYPSYGHALWEPSPRRPDRPVQVGDVGFIRRGKFHRLFNAMLPADHPSHERGVPEYHEPLEPTLFDHLDTSFLSSNDYCSAGVSIEPDPGYNASPDDFPQVTFRHKRTRGAAVLSLPVTTRREDTLAQGDFRRWIVRNIDSWFAFARKLGLGIDQMEEIILVTGCDRTRSWTNVAFLGNQVDSQVSFGVKVEAHDTTINFQSSRGNARGAVLRHGPEGANLPENQCVFIRGFRVARSFWILPRRLKAAAGPSPDPGGFDCDPDREVISIPAIPEYHDPLHLLIEYIAERASDCDMVLAHDDNLKIVYGLGHDTSLESLEPDVMMDLLQRSNIEINKVSWDLSPIDGGPSTDTSIVKVAMLSMTSENWNTTSPPQWSPIDLGHASDSGDASTSSLPDSFPVPTPRGDTIDSTLGGPGHAAEDIPPVRDKTRYSLLSVWTSLSKFAHEEGDRLLTAVIVTFCAVSLLGWVFSFTWDVIFKLFFSLLPFSIWFERYRRRLDDMYARLETYQNHIRSLQSNSAGPAVVPDIRYGFPIAAKAIPANLDILGQSGVQAIPEENTRGGPKELIIGFGDDDVEDRARQPSPAIKSPTPTPFQDSPSSPHPIDHTPPGSHSAGSPPPSVPPPSSPPSPPPPSSPPPSSLPSLRLASNPLLSPLTRSSSIAAAYGLPSSEGLPFSFLSRKPSPPPSSHATNTPFHTSPLPPKKERPEEATLIEF